MARKKVEASPEDTARWASLREQATHDHQTLHDTAPDDPLDRIAYLGHLEHLHTETVEELRTLIEQQRADHYSPTPWPIIAAALATTTRRAQQRFTRRTGRS